MNTSTRQLRIAGALTTTSSVYADRAVSTPAPFHAFLKTEIDQWAHVIKDACLALSL